MDTDRRPQTVTLEPMHWRNIIIALEELRKEQTSGFIIVAIDEVLAELRHQLKGAALPETFGI